MESSYGDFHYNRQILFTVYCAHIYFRELVVSSTAALFAAAAADTILNRLDMAPGVLTAASSVAAVRRSVIL